MKFAVSPEVRAKRIPLLILSTITLLVMGLIYAFSMFAAPISETFGLDRAAVGVTFNIMMVAFCVGALIGSELNKRFGLKASLVIAAVMFLAGFCVTALLGSIGLAVLYSCYALVGGIGVGIAYNTLISTTNLWFPDKIGFSSGVMLMSFGLGPLILGTLSVRMSEVIGIQPVLAGIGIIGAIVLVILATRIEYPAGYSPSWTTDPEELEPHERENILATPIFYVYWIWAVVIVAVGLATIGNAASDAQLVGIDAGFATLLVGLVSTTNGVSRVIIGAIYDRTGVKPVMTLVGIIAVMASILVIAAFITHTPWLYVTGALMCGFSYGGSPVVNSIFARTRFGAPRYSVNLSITNFCIAVGSVLNLLIGFIVGTENRLTVFTVILILALVALLSIILFSRMWNRDLARQRV